MEESKKILLPSKKFTKAPEEELNIRLDLETSESLMRIGDKDIILDVAELFNKERNESKNYKIYGKMRMVFRNMYSGSSEYSYIEERLYLNGDGSDNNFNGFLPYDEFAFLRRDSYREVNIPNAGSTLGTFTQNLHFSGSTSHRTITPITAPYQNWNLYLSYAYDSDDNFPIEYTLNDGTTAKIKKSFTSKDGIPFRVTNNGKWYTLTSPVEHGMSEGEYITISGNTLLNNIDLKTKTFYINSVGDEIYNSEKYVINILKTQFKNGYTLSSDVIILGKRCLDVNNIEDSTSKYYVHKNKTLTNIDGYIMDQIGFETPIFEDEKKILFENSAGVNDMIVERNRMESVLYDFKEPLILTGLTNNLGFTPTEVFLTTIFRNGDGYFNYPPKVGYKFNFHNTWIDDHFDGQSAIETGLTGTTTFTGVGGFTFTGGTDIPMGTILIGAFIEYNPKEMKERTISEPFHKLTIRKDILDHSQDTDVINFRGATSTNPFGIYYQAHHKIKLRELSPYTETAITNDIYNLPENTNYDSTEKVWRWRDLYDHGYVDVDGFGTNFPFINGQHYVKNDFNFYLRNERFYNNKQDGITNFNNRKIDC
jgi:hypothetical protein